MSKFKIQIDTSCLGIIEGDEKRFLSAYVDERSFTQRKNYDEYYVESDGVLKELEVSDLCIMAEHFKVVVDIDLVILESK